MLDLLDGFARRNKTKFPTNPNPAKNSKDLYGDLYLNRWNKETISLHHHDLFSLDVVQKYREEARKTLDHQIYWGPSWVLESCHECDQYIGAGGVGESRHFQHQGWECSQRTCGTLSDKEKMEFIQRRICQLWFPLSDCADCESSDNMTNNISGNI